MLDNTCRLHNAKGEDIPQMTRLADTAVIVGMTHGDEQILVSVQPWTRIERRLIGCFYGSAQPRVHMLEYLKYYGEGS